MSLLQTIVDEVKSHRISRNLTDERIEAEVSALRSGQSLYLEIRRIGGGSMLHTVATGSKDDVALWDVCQKSARWVLIARM